MNESLRHEPCIAANQSCSLPHFLLVMSDSPDFSQDPTSRAYPAYPFIGASVAVFRRLPFAPRAQSVEFSDRVLLARRTKPPFDGAFSLPGGLVEIGESLAAAALRELWEEVAVKARIVCFNRHVESIEQDEAKRIRYHFVIASFVAEWLGGDGEIGPEASEIIWARLDELNTLPCTPMVEPVVRAGYPLFLQHLRG
ncbi:NUDIX hydrolase [Beijerinckia indica]|uniref:NUDIX hydrolase n=1 Tax=Beijerinckia indica subsp. indica (strain ATCC 9039 / DSM 1715 / NCIMB 8712) TaxID=395963 RepID=B2IGI4_BEII9|nr:NUDIX hydrolase [Beijerinckia indica]ACB94366.1 NUDIX hydrolase [Beijerinckia indica subsp. indica ATCC 9039]